MKLNWFNNLLTIAYFKGASGVNDYMGSLVKKYYLGKSLGGIIFLEHFWDFYRNYFWLKNYQELF
jgi:hypothetical protein